MLNKIQDASALLPLSVIKRQLFIILDDLSSQDESSAVPLDDLTSQGESSAVPLDDLSSQG